MRNKRNSLCFPTPAAAGVVLPLLLMGSFVSAEEIYTKVWLNADAFPQEHAAQQQMQRSLANLPEARRARMVFLCNQYAHVQKLVNRLITEPDADGNLMTHAAAQEKAWAEVYDESMREARRTMASMPMQALLEAADDLDEGTLLGMMDTRLVWGMVAAMEHGFDAFDRRDDGRDDIRAHLIVAALGKISLNTAAGGNDLKDAQQDLVIRRAAQLIADGVEVHDAFNRAWRQVHAGSEITIPNYFWGAVVWASAGSSAPLKPGHATGMGKHTAPSFKAPAVHGVSSSSHQGGASSAPSLPAVPSLGTGSSFGGASAGFGGGAPSSGGAGMGGVAGGIGGPDMDDAVLPPAEDADREEEPEEEEKEDEKKKEEQGEESSESVTPVAASPMVRSMPLRAAGEAQSITVADGTSQSVTSPTTVDSVTLGKDSTLYVAANALTLNLAMDVQNNSHLVVKDGGVVQLGKYSDSSSSETNEKVARLFDALLNSTTTAGSGIVKIDSVSVQFGHGTAYNLADAKTGLNADFAARYEIETDLNLQNFNQGSAHSKDPVNTPASRWVISQTGDVHVKGNFSLSSYQQMDVKGGTLVVDGNTYLGHSDTRADYHAVLNIADGSYVKLKNIGDARTDGNGKSELEMTGGTLVFTADGNVVTNKLGSITLSGGELVADGHSWVLNNDATLGSKEGLTIRTDANNSITLGTDGTTMTLAGQVSVSEKSKAELNGTYAGAGNILLNEGSTLVLGENFVTADKASVGLEGAGTVQVNWPGYFALENGFMESYDITYRPSQNTGGLDLSNAAGLSWKDAEGNRLNNVSYRDGALTGTVQTDSTIYRIVTEGHQAVFDEKGNADKATAFRLYNDGKLFIGENHSVAAEKVTQNGHTLTLQGSGDYVLNGYTMPQKVVFDTADGTAWTGAVVISGTASGTPSFNKLYQQGSVIAMNGYNGIPTEWYNGTLTANIRLDAQADGSPSWRWDNGSPRTTVKTTFQGNWSGAGDFVMGAEKSTNWLQNFTYEGDISAWTGRFLVESGTTTLTLAKNANAVNAVLDKGAGTLNLKVETDTKLNANVTVNDLAITAGKTVEVGRDAVVDITAKKYGAVEFDNLVDSLTGAGTVKMQGGEYQMGNTTAAGQAHDFKTNYVFTSGLTLMDWTGYTTSSWNVLSDEEATEGQTVKNGSLTVQSGDLWMHNRQTLNIHGGSVTVENGTLKLGLSGGYTAYATMDGGSLTAQGLNFVVGTGNNNIDGKPTSFTMTGGTLNITGSTFAAAGSAAGAAVTLSGGTLLADNHAWTLNYNSSIGGVSVVTQGESGGITFGQQGVTTTLTDVVDNRGNLTLDGTVKLTMATSNTAYGFVDAAGNINYSGVGFDATITMPGEVYNVVSGNAAAMGNNLTWTANGQALTVVAEADKGSAPANALYFDGFNLRPVRDLDNPETKRTGSIYHMGARGDYTMSAEDAAIATGIELTGRGGALHVGTTPANTVSLDLAAGSLVLENGADLTVGEGQNWAMEAGASVVLGEGSVLTLPGVWGETTPNSYTNSYSAYHLLHNTTGAGKVLFEGDVSWQFGNAGHNTVSTGGYNILDEYGENDGVNADITFDLEVNGNMLIQNYRQGKDHPDPGSWWKVSKGGSLTVHGNFESSSYQKVSVDGGDLVVDGTYKIGHEAGREYEGDLELKNGSLTVGTLQTVHEDTSTVHISGGKLTVTKGNAFANTFREVSAKDAEFEGTWTWNHDATIGNITVTQGSAITLGTKDTTLTLESPLKNHGDLTLNGTIKADIEKQEGAWSYGTDATGYTPDGDGYYKRTDDLYTLISEGNNAELGANIKFILNGETLSADDFNWDGKAIGMGGTEAGTVYYLNTENGYTYTLADTRTTSFELVNTGATLRLERELAGEQSIHALGGTVSLGSGVSMEAARLNAENTVTMAGEGTYLLSGNALMKHPTAHKVDFTKDAWTGTVQMSGQLGLEGTLNALGNAGSWVEMQGVFGADAAGSMNVNVKLTDTAHEPAWIYTGDGHDVAVTGDWAGEGTFAFAPVGGAAQQLTYSGNLSAWSGAFSAEGGTAQLHFAGEANKVNAAMQQKGGRIELTAETDTRFTNTTQAAVYEAAGGDLTADDADAAAAESIRAAGGDVTLKGLAEAASVSLKELALGDSRTVSAYKTAADAQEEQKAAIEVTEKLQAGSAATLNADLTVQSGAVLDFTNKEGGLAVNGSLTLSQGGGIELADSMKSYLHEHGGLVLFTGVTEIHFGEEAPAVKVAITADATEYFNRLLADINAGSSTQYYIVYSGAEEGGIVAIIPEPASTTLSLLGLAALAARRRRK